MRMANNALRIDKEYRARIHAAFLVEDAVGLADRTVRPVIRKQRERHAAELLRPGFQARDGVGAQLQNFNTEFLEFFVVLTEPFDLVRSPTGKREWQECHHRPLAPEAAQGQGSTVMRCQRKLRRLGTCL